MEDTSDAFFNESQQIKSDQQNEFPIFEFTLYTTTYYIRTYSEQIKWENFPGRIYRIYKPNQLNNILSNSQHQYYH